MPTHNPPPKVGFDCLDADTLVYVGAKRTEQGEMLYVYAKGTRSAQLTWADAWKFAIWG